MRKAMNQLQIVKHQRIIVEKKPHVVVMIIFASFLVTIMLFVISILQFVIITLPIFLVNCIFPFSVGIFFFFAAKIFPTDKFIEFFPFFIKSIMSASVLLIPWAVFMLLFGRRKKYIFEKSFLTIQNDILSWQLSERKLPLNQLAPAQVAASGTDENDNKLYRVHLALQSGKRLASLPEFSSRPYQEQLAQKINNAVRENRTASAQSSLDDGAATTDVLHWRIEYLFIDESPLIHCFASELSFRDGFLLAHLFSDKPMKIYSLPSSSLSRMAEKPASFLYSYFLRYLGFDTRQLSLKKAQQVQGIGPEHFLVTSDAPSSARRWFSQEVKRGLAQYSYNCGTHLMATEKGCHLTLQNALLQDHEVQEIIEFWSSHIHPD
jgi:hypothetical protein